MYVCMYVQIYVCMCVQITQLLEYNYVCIYVRNKAKKKRKKSVKRQTDTKTQWNTLQVSLLYSFHLRKSKV